MNVNPDSPPMPDSDGASADSVETPTKPVRRPRAPKVVVDSVAPPADGAAVDEPAPAAPKAPRKRKAVPIEAADTPLTAEAPASPGEPVDTQQVRPEQTPLPTLSAEPSPSPAPRIETRSEAETGARVEPRAAQQEGVPGEAGGDAHESVQGDGPSGGDGAEGENDGASDGPRGRRRNRRDRKRGERGDAVAGSAGQPGDPADDSATPAPAAVAAEASAVFAQVLSGDFDVEEEAPAEPTEEGAAPKRVLAPEPEAPKLHKVLAQAGIGSRRDMEDLILDGSITVNGEPAHVGQRISFGDQVKVNGKPVKLRIMPLPPRIIAYHKPVGEIVTHDDPQNRPTVFRRLPRLQQGKWQSVGRLDINTEGLLLFTNSGELANQLMHPRFGVEREYAVRVLGVLEPEAKAQLLEGVMVEGQKCGFRSIEDGGGEGANHWYRVVITEGRNREVRKLFDVVGLTVSRLIRIRYGTVVLPHGLKRGVWTDLEDSDVRAIRRLAGGDRGQQQSRDGQHGGRGNERGGQQKQRNDRQGGQGARQNDRGRGNNPQPGRFNEPQQQAAPQGHDEDRGFDSDSDSDIDFDPRSIPNPLEQTFDKRFVQNPRSPAGGRGFGRGGGGFGAGGSAPAPGPSGGKKGQGPSQPDPLQTSLGFIGADAFHRKNRGGGGGGGGNRGGNRGGGGGGNFGGGGGGGGGGYGGGGRRGR
jgi:23S rRNA pseudouridine2605 synthase